MISIMISIQPKWVEKILNGEKTIEIRKTMPKCELSCKVYIYCTKAKLPKQGVDCVKADHLTKPHPLSRKYILGANYDECLNGKVVAEFTLNKVRDYVIKKRDNKFYWGFESAADIENLLNKSCLNGEQIFNYIGDCNHCYAWHIDNLKIYDKPKELREFKTIDNASVQKCKYREQSYYDGYCIAGYLKCGFYCSKTDNWCDKCLKKPITKAPQGWCYVEEM